MAEFTVSCNSHSSSVRRVLAIPSSKRGADWLARGGVRGHGGKLPRPGWTHNSTPTTNLMKCKDMLECRALVVPIAKRLSKTSTRYSYRSTFLQ